jgi:hypothetical protein
LQPNEILGDWSNLKGTYYHLVYALWLLLREEAFAVALFRGNDLRARPATPPVLEEAELGGAVVTARARHGDKNVLIQLKATADSWSLAKILEGTLVQIFVCSAIESRRSAQPLFGKARYTRARRPPSDPGVRILPCWQAASRPASEYRGCDCQRAAGTSPIPDSTSNHLRCLRRPARCTGVARSAASAVGACRVAGAVLHWEMVDYLGHDRSSQWLWTTRRSGRAVFRAL